MNPTTIRNESAPRPIVFGEVLFDAFPDGEVLGGAAFNIAWNLQGLGAEPLLLTRIGSDERGERILSAMRSWGMSTRGVQIDPKHPTGFVSVELAGGEPRFDIVADVAYDFIECEPAVEAARASQGSVLYHGSLITRAPVSRDTLARIERQTHLPRFVDINLRPPWWDRDRVEKLLQGAHSVKLNEHELISLGDSAEGRDLEQCATALRDRFRIGRLIVTCGSDGAMLVDGEGVYRAESPAVGDLKDTVGAGDAFAAVSLLGAHQGWKAQDIVERAVQFAASVCALRGATTLRREHYRAAVASWA